MGRTINYLKTKCKRIFRTKQKQLASGSLLLYYSNMKTESAKIIEALGDTAVLAKKLNLRKPTVQAWKKRGIPPKIQLAHPRLIAKGRRLAEAQKL